MDRYEFFWTTDKTRLIIHDLTTDEFEPFGASKISLARRIDARVRETYPIAHARLCEIYGDSDAMAFARSNRFLKCNFSVHDNQPDIDDDGNFLLELVPCPLRGECKDGICCPKLSSILINRENEVIRNHVEGFTQEEIGRRMFISEHTVHNHLANIYAKLGLTGNPNPDKLLITYAYKHKIVC